MSNREFWSLTKQLDMPPETRRVLGEIRESDPARPVGDNAILNMRCRMASTKMGHTISVESRTCELPFAIRHELYKGTLEIWAQPRTFTIERRINGRRHVSNYTPDFLIIQPRRVMFVECKTLRGLHDLLAERPQDWRLDNGAFRFLPGVALFDKMQVRFDIWPAPARAGILNSNLETLLALHPLPARPINSVEYRKAVRLLSDGGMAIADLCERVRGLTEGDVVAWVGTGNLHACLRSQLLTMGSTSVVFSTGVEAKKRDELLCQAPCFGGQPGDQVIDSRLLRASAADLALAKTRWQELQSVFSGARSPTRNEYRYVDEARRAIAENRNPIEALLPDARGRGNGECRLPDQKSQVVDAMTEIRNEGHKVTLARVLDWLQEPKNQKGLERATDTTIRKWMKEIPIEDAARQEGGKRAFHRARPPSDPRDATLRGQVPGMYAHIDASQWDTRVWDKLPWAEGLPCPWWLVAYDECGDKEIGFSIALGKEDRFAVALLMDDIAKSQGFMPHFTVSDRGAAYQSTWFQEFEATMTMHGFDRSAGNPRSGSQVENPIGIAMKQLAHRLLGSTALDRSGRQVDGNKKSRAHACHVLATLNTEGREFFRTEYNAVRHGASLLTPNETWAEARARYPHVGRPLPDPDTWEVLLSIPIKEKVRVDLNKGIRTYYRTYRSGQLTAELRKTAKPDDIRLSARTPTMVHVRFGRKWVRAYSQDHLVQSSLPSGHQSVELLLRRLMAPVNVTQRQQSAIRMDQRTDELNYSAKAAKAAKASENHDAEDDAPEGETKDLFDTITWD